MSLKFNIIYETAINGITEPNPRSSRGKRERERDKQGRGNERLSGRTAVNRNIAPNYPQGDSELLILFYSYGVMSRVAEGAITGLGKDFGARVDEA